MAVDLKHIAAPSAHTSWDPDPGDQIKGEITFAKIMGAKPNFDGDKLEQELRVDLVDEGGEQWTVWAVVNTDVDGDGYPSRLARAIAGAVNEAGADQLAEGGTLALARLDDVPPTKKGRHPAKDYAGAYQAPTAKVKLALAPEHTDDEGDDEPESEPPKRPTAADLLGS